MTATSEEVPRKSRIAAVPPSVFGIVMGVTGLGLAWRQLDHTAATASKIGDALIGLGGVLLLVALVCYGIKAIRFPQRLAADLEHPVTSNFICAATMSAMLVAQGFMAIAPVFAEYLWLAGALGQLAFALRQIRFWIIRNWDIRSSNPAWFMIVGGSLLAPVTGVPLGYMELSWCLFAIGVVLWLVLFAIVMNRIIFHDQLPREFVPTLFIMITPPALGFLAYFQLNGGEVDGFARIFFYTALMVTALVLTMTRLFHDVPFGLTWWAYTFPLDAITTAALLYSEQIASWQLRSIALALLILTNLTVLFVFYRTMRAVLRGELFRSESV